MYGILHLNDLVLPEVDEVRVVSSVDLESISGDLALYLLAEVLKDPSNVHPIKIPLQVTENDEVVHPRVTVLVILLQYIIFFIAAQLQKE